MTTVRSLLALRRCGDYVLHDSKEECALRSKALHQRGGGESCLFADLGERQFFGSDPAKYAKGGFEDRGIVYSTWAW
jgi:hypothetical protein